MTPSLHVEPLTVRDAREADFPALLGMIDRFIDTHYAGLMRKSEEAQLAMLELSLRQGGLLVATTPDDVPVGFIGTVVAALPSSGEVAGIECALWVDPAYRVGGIGRRLLCLAEGWAETQGALVMQLTQPTRGGDRELLARWYRALGFVEVETLWQKRL